MQHKRDEMLMNASCIFFLCEEVSLLFSVTQQYDIWELNGAVQSAELAKKIKYLV